ncbi:HEAT repeat domain-containing protein [Microbacterium esteraromaticum]|uniref:HEAT repeat domain-containing protein n=1 Tax=Microbacterium esteraromaticum TaxID=57043 RepID=UPI0015C61D83|nr:HEAT repeat domain-containing protein [Microbacterium esteraromaticum]
MSTPGERVRRESALRGDDAVVADCLALLAGRDVDPEFIYALGGPPARWAITGDVGGPDYWLRVWALRGLLYVFADCAAPEVIDALSDEHWRVREMAAKVCARRRIEGVLPLLAKLRDDPNMRVQRAAERASMRVVS